VTAEQVAASLPDLDALRLSPDALLLASFDLSGQAIEFDRVVAIAAEVWGIKDRPTDSFKELFAARGKSPALWTTPARVMGMIALTVGLFLLLSLFWYQSRKGSAPDQIARNGASTNQSPSAQPSQNNAPAVNQGEERTGRSRKTGMIVRQKPLWKTVLAVPPSSA
jgi:hypothetical protein